MDILRDTVSERAATRRHRQNLLVQITLTVFTGLAFLAAAYYAYETSALITISNNTYTEISKQTALLQRQLIGTQAAVLQISEPQWDEKSRTLNLPLSNIGVSNASILHSTPSIVRQSYPNLTPIGEAVDLPIPNQTLRGSNGPNSGANPQWQLPWPMPSGKFDDAHPWPGDEVVIMKGSITYNDAFEIQTKGFCYLKLPVWQIPSLSWVRRL